MWVSKCCRHRCFEGLVYQAATLSGNPMTMTSGLATMAVLTTGYDQVLSKQTQALAKVASAMAQKHQVPLDTGMYWPPSAYESVFISIQHDDATLAKTVEA